MTQYHVRENTPLKYHNLVRYFALPVGIISCVAQLTALVGGMVEFNWLYGVDIAVYIATIVLMTVAFVGFFSWSGYAWRCLMANYWLGVCYAGFLVAVYAVLLPDELATAIGSLVGQIIVLIPISIYYHKRKPLFFTCSVHDSFGAPAQSEDPWAASYRPASGEEKYCRMCGFELLPDSAFCSKCGAPVLGKPDPACGSDRL